MASPNPGPPFSYILLAGATAGISETLALYPLDVVKTRLQLQRSGGGQPQYSGMCQCFSKILKQDGFGRFYRGIAAPILMETPKRASKFAGNDWWGRFYGEMLESPGNKQSLAVLTGASTGATEALVVVPFELVKIRLQDPKSSLQYKGVFDCALKTAHEAGPLGLYRGFESTLWRHIVWNAGYFGCIFKVRSLLDQRYSNQGATLIDFFAGSIGGTVATVINTPFDVVKSRIQGLGPGATGNVKIPWVWMAVYHVYKAEGFKALYKGLLPKILRFAPGGGMMLVVYTSTINLLSS